MDQSTLEAIKFIKQSGFPYIKFELEANMNRPDDDEYCERQDCYNCEGSGYIACDTCDGDGVVLSETPGQFAECENCNIDGRITCQACGGVGYSDEYDTRGSDEYCQNFIEEYVSAKAAEVRNYGSFYYDGSVDSEYTFTLPIDNLDLVIEYINAFKALSDDLGGDFDTRGAGMHISVLPTSDYPCNASLPDDKVNNFISQVSLLMPALFFVASSNSVSRTLDFRNPKVSYSEKYNAIYCHEGTCFEYRLFETCYDKPEAIYDYVQVIANTLRFYADPSLKVKPLRQQFRFNERNRYVSRFYEQPEQLRILQQLIPIVKPKSKSYSQLRKERGVLTLPKAELKAKKELCKIEADYQRYVKEHKEQVKEIKQGVIKALKDKEPSSYKDQMTKELAYVVERDRVTEEQAIKILIKDRTPNRRTFRQFMQRFSNTTTSIRV